MSWTDRLSHVTPINWAAVGLLAINVFMLPFMLFSDEPHYDDSMHPSIELLMNSGELTMGSMTNSHGEEKMSNNMVHGNGTEGHISSQGDVTEPHVQDSDAHAEVSIKTQPLEEITEHPTRVCYEIGPIKTDDEQIKLRSQVEIKGMFASIKYSTAREDLGYWVFIPPLRSKSLGRLKVEELKLKGFNDVVLLTRNEPKNAVSLGVFDDQKNAYKRMLKAQSLGFDAKMDIRYQRLDHMWLAIEVSRQRDLDDAGWAELLVDYPNIQLRPVNCVQVAQQNGGNMNGTEISHDVGLASH